METATLSAALSGHVGGFQNFESWPLKCFFFYGNSQYSDHLQKACLFLDIYLVSDVPNAKCLWDPLR